jgi:hypothetical protein
VPNERRSRPPCHVEPLEARTLLSAGVFDPPPDAVFDLHPPAAATRATHTTPAIATRPLAVARNPYPQVVGTWIGTCKTAGKRGLVEVAVRITRQVNGGATGKFALGPVTAWHKVLSTAVVSPTRDRGFRVILPSDTFYGSVNATITSDGRQIFGRWTCNNDGTWKSGTIVLNRQ